MNQDVIICRCQEVTELEIVQAIREGAVTINGVKKRTHAGMGICQGKTCERMIAALISRETNIPLDEIVPDTQRAPVRPLDINSFL